METQGLVTICWHLCEGAFTTPGPEILLLCFNQGWCRKHAHKHAGGDTHVNNHKMQKRHLLDGIQKRSANTHCTWLKRRPHRLGREMSSAHSSSGLLSLTLDILRYIKMHMRHCGEVDVRVLSPVLWWQLAGDSKQNLMKIFNWSEEHSPWKTNAALFFLLSQLCFPYCLLVVRRVKLHGRVYSFPALFFFSYRSTRHSCQHARVHATHTKTPACLVICIKWHLLAVVEYCTLRYKTPS